jgi:hypothetical protein
MTLFSADMFKNPGFDVLLMRNDVVPSRYQGQHRLQALQPGGSGDGPVCPLLFREKWMSFGHQLRTSALQRFCPPLSAQ